MFSIKRGGTSVKVMVLLTVFVFISSGIGWTAGLYRINPKGKVFVYEGGQKVAEYSREAPYPLGKTLKTSGICAVDLGATKLVADDKTTFAVSEVSDQLILRVESGTLFFAISDKSPSLVFSTPGGDYMSRRVLLNASTDASVMQGYLKVSETGSELGILKGGSMMVSSVGGDNWIQEGNKIILAQAEGGLRRAGLGGVAGGGLVGEGFGLAPFVVLTTIIGGTSVGVALQETQNDDDDVPASPVAPPFTPPGPPPVVPPVTPPGPPQ